MIGAIIGDIIGSVYEWQNIKRTDFDLYDPKCRWTDDTVLTIATADAVLHKKNYAEAYKEWGRRYPHAGYGSMFSSWLRIDNLEAYNSYGNGSAMRVSPVGWAFNDLQEVLAEAERSASATHNHEFGIHGAQAVASGVFLARQGKSKKEIKEYIADNFLYDLNRTLDSIRPDYRFDVTCQGSVPEAIIAFLESKDFEDAIRKAISLGGDSDTISCITSGLAQAYYGEMPNELVEFARKRLPKNMLEVVEAFEKKFVLL